MGAVAIARRILAVGALLLGVSQGSCEGAIATNSLPANLKVVIDKVLARPKPADRLKGLIEAAKNLSLREIPGALQAAEEFQQLRERAVFQEAVLKQWSEMAPSDAFAHIAALPENRIKLETIRAAANKLANQNCEEAAKALQRMGPGRSRNDAVDVIAGVWARKDIKEALKWANTLPAGFARETALNTIHFVWVHSDPVSAVDHVKELPAGDIKNALLTNIAGEWAASDPQAALRWANSLGDGPEKDLVIANIAEAWADSDPLAAAGFAFKLSGDLKQNAVTGVISRWATQNPEAALNWAVKAGDHAIQSRAFPEVLNLWASVDASKAGEWVEKLLPGSTRETAIQSYVEAVVTWEPSQALRLAQMLKDESVRFEQVKKCLERWMELDGASAQKWIAENDRGVLKSVELRGK